MRDSFGIFWTASPDHLRQLLRLIFFNSYASNNGADMILAQGWESGGHVRGEISTMALVPRIVDAIGKTPVVAAGGISDGRGIAAALMLGASAVSLGTRFVATSEARVPKLYRDALIHAETEDTIFGETFNKGWPNSNMRTLINSTMRDWLASGRPEIGQRPGDDDIVATTHDGNPIPRYHVTQPCPGIVGDQETLAFYAGQGVGLITDVLPAGELVARLIEETGIALESPNYQGRSS